MEKVLAWARDVLCRFRPLPMILLLPSFSGASSGPRQQ
jgi:hypothetical protein